MQIDTRGSRRRAKPFTDLRLVSNMIEPSSSGRNHTGVTSGEPSRRTTPTFAVRVPGQQERTQLRVVELAHRPASALADVAAEQRPSQLAALEEKLLQGAVELALGDDERRLSEMLGRPPDEERLLERDLRDRLLQEALERSSELAGRDLAGTVIRLHDTSPLRRLALPPPF